MSTCSVPPALGGSLVSTCHNSFLLFTLLDSLLYNTEDISEIHHRIRDTITPDLEYDYVVIGGGSGGATAAGRLAGEKLGKVLLIEAGRDEPVQAQVPNFMDNYFKPPVYDWGYKTQPEPVACQGYPEKRCPWRRGKVLGGCSTVNGLIYVRGVPRDYDSWGPGWSYKDVLPVYIEQEDNRQIGTLVEAEYHGTKGALTVERYPYHPPLAADILHAVREFGYPVTHDLNGKHHVGFAIAQTNNRNGTRLSAAKAYVAPQRNNPLLDVTLNSLASKIDVETIDGKKVATHVSYLHKGELHKVKVRKEVIVSGGTVNSPQILMLSGIGPKEELEKHGIPVVHDLPGVGRNMKNHVSFHVVIALKKLLNTFDFSWEDVARYLLYGQGPLSGTGLLQGTALINSKYADPAGDYPDIQIFYSGYSSECSVPGKKTDPVDPEYPNAPKIVGIDPVYTHAKSVGNISLKSSNPEDHPLIYANYLTEPEDVKGLTEAIRVALNLTKSEYLVNKYGFELVKGEYDEVCNKFEFDSDEYWACAVKYMTRPENHQIGSCKMGSDTDPMAVVDYELKVRGLENIRVMDASIIPELTSSGTAPIVMMIGYRGVEIIKNGKL